MTYKKLTRQVNKIIRDRYVVLEMEINSTVEDLSTLIYFV